jgi:adenylate cyclase
MDGNEREISCPPLLTIGRKPPNEVVVSHPRVSRNHAIVRMLRSGEYYVIDMGSTNGTYLNGQRVVMPTLLNNLDVICIEDCTITFRVVSEPVCEEDEDEDSVTMTMTSVGLQSEEITLLVCDIRNYTKISEQISPTELASVMARWFKQVTKVIESCGGTIDKFIGDAVMVRWSTEGVEDKQAAVCRALEAAVALDGICGEINQKYRHLPFPIRIGAGINTGQAILGNMGGGTYREYTAIGDAVNLTFRFESASKTLNSDIVIGPDSYQNLAERFWKGRCQSVNIKGRDAPILVWPVRFAEVKAMMAQLRT